MSSNPHMFAINRNLRSTVYMTETGAIYVSNSQVYLQRIRRDYALSSVCTTDVIVNTTQNDGTILYTLRVTNIGHSKKKEELT